MLGGVAIGMAHRFGLPVWLVRLGWLLLFIPGGLPGILPYAVLWIVIPSE